MKENSDFFAHFNSVSVKVDGDVPEELRIRRLHDL